MRICAASPSSATSSSISPSASASPAEIRTCSRRGSSPGSGPSRSTISTFGTISVGSLTVVVAVSCSQRWV
ncbi:Vmc-like lipoprotein signal peptide domain-containing protein [Nannocystis exedens]|uniref:Vmc-like lipoprotein signal peptide domain-containing protein n=1 Tax=Nannocystis exedens TaxID=54 RepID=UPI003B838B73